MYHQVLYQIGDKLNSILQNNRMTPDESLVLAALSLVSIIGGGYTIYKIIQDEKQKKKMRIYKTT